MKHTDKANKEQPDPRESDDLDPNYDFDYSKAQPNKFSALPKEQMVVLLDKDITKYFRTPEEVTNALRSLIQAFPHHPSPSGQ